MTDSSGDALEATATKGVLRVEITGAQANQAAKLLEDAAAFLRDTPPPADFGGDEYYEMMFRRAKFGDLVIISLSRPK